MHTILILQTFLKTLVEIHALNVLSGVTVISLCYTVKFSDSVYEFLNQGIIRCNTKIKSKLNKGDHRINIIFNTSQEIT